MEAWEAAGAGRDDLEGDVRSIREIAEEVFHGWGCDRDGALLDEIGFAEEVAARVLAESILDRDECARHEIAESWLPGLPQAEVSKCQEG